MRQRWIIINHGDVFEGTTDQFRDCFFDNAYPDVIFKWALSHGFSCEIINLKEEKKNEDSTRFCK